MQTLYGLAKSKVKEVRERQDLLGKLAKEGKSAQALVDSAGILLKNRELRGQAQELLEKLTDLQTRHQDSLAAFKAFKEKSEAHAADLEAAAGARMERVRGEHQREVARLQALLKKEQEEKGLLSKRLDQEVKDAQGLMMNFGDAQAETQLKRKLSHLRAEHNLMKDERDHYKRLCRSQGQ